MIRRTTTAALTLALAFTLAACGGAEESDVEDTREETAQTETPEPEESQESEAAAEGDRTEDLRSAANGEPWAESITAATETEPGRLEVETDLVDPRGDGGSAEAETAIEICEAAVSLLEDHGAEEPYVAVMEEDGTHWVLYGHPAYPDGCAEV